jgi:hypothetical protein
LIVARQAAMILEVSKYIYIYIYSKGFDCSVLEVNNFCMNITFFKMLRPKSDSFKLPLLSNKRFSGCKKNREKKKMKATLLLKKNIVKTSYDYICP